MTQPFAPTLAPSFSPPAANAENTEALAGLAPLLENPQLAPLLQNLATNRRGLLLAPLLAPLLTPLLAALPATLMSAPARALDPTETQITLPGQLKWQPWSGAPPHSSETAALFGATDKAGPYVVAIRWYPGYMSAPHSYATDRYCFVLSGTWWVNSGEQFEPEATVPVPAGGFVRRVARTPHYDGVKRGEKEPVVIGIVGLAPIDLKLVDPSKPPWREV